MKYAYTLFMKFSARCIHPNYLFYSFNVSVEFVLIYRPHPVLLSVQPKKQSLDAQKYLYLGNITETTCKPFNPKTMGAKGVL